MKNMIGMIPIKIKDIEMLSFESLNSFGDIFNFVTTRNGAVAGDPYSSFNLGVHSGESVEKVLMRQNILREALGINQGNFILPRQVHGCNVAVVDRAFLDKSLNDQKEAVSQVDALITNIPKVCIGVTTADCVPVLLYDPVKKSIAAIHAGWRGTVQHIVSTTLRRMQTDFGSSPSDIYAAIGPSISLSQFEVGDEVYWAFKESYANIEKLSMKHPITEKYHIDLWKANYSDLCAAGVDVSHIEIAGICTKTHNELFFSARALGPKSGRFISGIYLR